MSKISSEYAKALFMLATEENCGKEYGDALGMVSELFLENPKYLEFLGSLSVPVEERISALDAAFSDAVPTNVLSFVKLLCEKKHIDEFYECAEQYKAMLSELNRVSYAGVTSAVALGDDEKSALMKKLEKISGHRVEVSYSVDASILGGIIVEMDGKVMDSSLQKHLKDVKEVISK